MLLQVAANLTLSHTWQISYINTICCCCWDCLHCMSSHARLGRRGGGKGLLKHLINNKSDKAPLPRPLSCSGVISCLRHGSLRMFDNSHLAAQNSFVYEFRCARRRSVTGTPATYTGQEYSLSISVHCSFFSSLPASACILLSLFHPAQSFTSLYSAADFHMEIKRVGWRAEVQSVGPALTSCQLDGLRKGGREVVRFLRGNSAKLLKLRFSNDARWEEANLKKGPRINRQGFGSPAVHLGFKAKSCPVIV